MGERRARYAAGRDMIRRVRPLLAFAALCAIVVAPGVARAQFPPSSSGVSSSGGMPGTSGTENVSSALPNPNRALLQNGQYVDVTNNPRPLNLNPTGVSFSDCEQDLKLTFPVVLSGFTGGSGFEVWAGPSRADCTQAGARGIGDMPTCWRLGPPATSIVAAASTTVSVDVYARDVLRYEGGVPPLAPYDPAFHGSPQGESACHVQPTDEQVRFVIDFLPVGVSNDVGMVLGMSFGTELSTDLLGPPPPKNLQLSPGGGLLDAVWSNPGNDPDVQGFAFWTDPPPDAGVPVAVDGGDDAGAASCASAVLTSHTIVDEALGGISQIPQANAAGEVDDPSATSFELTGLTGDARYAVAVTSVDGTGNYGPPAPLACATTSVDASGDQRLVGGCLCTLARRKSSGAAAAVVTSGVVIVVIGRRRRRSRSS